MSLGNCRSDDQSCPGNGKHQQTNFGQRIGWGLVKLQCDNNAKIKDQQAAHNTLDPLAHSDPDDRNECQIVELFVSQCWRKHNPEHQNNTSCLSDRLQCTSQFDLWCFCFEPIILLGGLCVKRRENPPDPWKQMNKKERSKTN